VNITPLAEAEGRAQCHGQRRRRHDPTQKVHQAPAGGVQRRIRRQTQACRDRGGQERERRGAQEQSAEAGRPHHKLAEGRADGS